MALYRVEWKHSAIKDLRKLPKSIIERIIHATDSLCDSPRPRGARKLTGSESTYRLRVGNYRVVYSIFDRKLLIEIVRVRNRKNAYE